MSVNKLWILICKKHEDRISTFGLVYQQMEFWSVWNSLNPTLIDKMTIIHNVN